MRAGALYCPAGAESTHLADAGLKRVSPGGRGRNISFLRIAAILFDGSRAFPARTRAYFSLVGKVGKSTPRRGTLSIVSPSWEPPPRNDTKGGARPLLDFPACPILVLLFYGYSRRCIPRTMFRPAPIDDGISLTGPEAEASLSTRPQIR